MRKINILSRQSDFDQERLDNEGQTIFKTRPIQLYKVNKENKWQKELENIDDYIEKEMKRIVVESKEERQKKEEKVIFWKKQAYISDLTTF